MFDWLFKKEFKAEELPRIIDSLLPNLKRMREAFVIALVATLKTEIPELRKNKSWKLETIHDVPSLNCAFCGFQVICFSEFFYIHKFNKKNTSERKIINEKIYLTLLEEICPDVSKSKISYYFYKYLYEKNNHIMMQSMTKDVVELSSIPNLNDIQEQNKLLNAVYSSVNSMRAQVFIELANFFGEKKLVDKYLLEAGHGKKFEEIN